MSLSTKTYSTEEGRSYLRRLIQTSDPQYQQMVADGEAVHREYGWLLAPENLHRLKAQDFKSFLLYENNRHWWGIHRHQAKLVRDMDLLRAVLRDLLDETRPIDARINKVEGVPGPKPLSGLGKAVYTPVLHVVYPDRYGVWNSISETAMRRLGFWPTFSWGATPGQKYAMVNRAIIRIAGELGVDLWTLDSLWWLTERQHEPTRHQFEGGTGTSGASSPHQRGARATSYFTCSRCFQLKAGNLRDPSGDHCVDCA